MDRRLAVPFLALVAAVSLALYAGWRVRRWSAGKQEKRLRSLHTLTGNVNQESFQSEVLGTKRRV